MRVYTAIRLPFLFHTATISLSVSFWGDSMTIFIKLINFMSEKLCSADAVEMGIDKHMVASLYRWRIML